MNGMNSHLGQMMHRYASALEPAPAWPASAVSELDGFIRNLPPEERRAIEADPRFMQAKGALYEAFIAYSIVNTPAGAAFCSGAGLPYAQALLDEAKAVHREVAGKIEGRSQTLERRLEEQGRKLEESEKLIANLYEQLGVKNNAASPA